MPWRTVAATGGVRGLLRTTLHLRLELEQLIQHFLQRREVPVVDGVVLLLQRDLKLVRRACGQSRVRVDRRTRDISPTFLAAPFICLMCLASSCSVFLQATDGVDGHAHSPGAAVQCRQATQPDLLFLLDFRLMSFCSMFCAQRTRDTARRTRVTTHAAHAAPAAATKRTTRRDAAKPQPAFPQPASPGMAAPQAPQQGRRRTCIWACGNARREGGRCRISTGAAGQQVAGRRQGSANGRQGGDAPRRHRCRFRGALRWRRGRRQRLSCEVHPIDFELSEGPLRTANCKAPSIQALPPTPRRPAHATRRARPFTRHSTGTTKPIWIWTSAHKPLDERLQTRTSGRAPARGEPATSTSRQPVPLLAG